MACGEPSSSFVQQIKATICQICGGNANSSHSQEHEINYQKQVDPPATPYTQIIPDYRYKEIEEEVNRRKGPKANKGKPAPVQLCIPIPTVCDKAGAPTPSNTPEASPAATSTPKKNEDGGAKEQKQSGETGNSTALKGSCLPAGGSSCPPPVKMMLCLPCPPPQGVGTSAGPGASTPCPRSKPVDYTYRCESRELRGGNLYQCCQCNKRNGLQHDCPRTPCQGRPACLVKPWPDCWPSGGCHGIDYSRERGVKRHDPCREQRFDKKECRPPGSEAPKSDCGGNMMVIVCPPPNQG